MTVEEEMLRGSEQVDAMDVWFSVSLMYPDVREGKKDFVMLSEST